MPSGSSTRTLTLIFAGDTDQLNKTTNDVNNKLGAVGDKANGVGGKLKGLFAGIGPAVAGAFAGLAVGDFLKDSIGAASDLNETISKTEQIFGDASKSLIAWSKTSAKTLGQSQQQALDAAATFGTFGKAAGLTGKDLAAFSGGLTGLASDMASFSNTSPEQAIEALAAGLRGESEPLRAYGVLLDDASLKAEALSLGILKPVQNQSKITAAQLAITDAQKNLNDMTKKFGPSSLEAQKAQSRLATAQDTLKTATEGVIDTLTPQQKVLASNSLIFKQTTLAQDDFAKTSDGLANKTRILQAQFADFKVTIGQQLLPIVLKLVNSIDGLVKAFGQTYDYIKRNILVIGTVTAALAAMIITANAGAIAYFLFGVAVNTWSAITKIATAVAFAFNAVINANPISLIIIAIIAFVAVLVILYQKSDTVRAIIQAAWAAIQVAISAAWDVLKIVFAVWIAEIEAVIAIVQFLWANVIKPVFGYIADWIGKSVSTIVSWVGTAIDALGKIGGAAANVYNAVSDWIGRAVGVISGLPGKILGVVSSVTSAGAALAKGFYDGFKSLVADVGSGIVTGLTAGLNAVVINPINSAINFINSKLISNANKIPGVNIPQIPNIPKLAKGGIITRETLAILGEGGRREAVIPLPTNGAVGARGGSVVNNYITINVPETANPAETGRVVIDKIRAYERAAGNGWRSA